MTLGGVLSTAGGLVFTGDAEGNFIALNAATGKALCTSSAARSVYSSPMSFALTGNNTWPSRQAAALFTFALP